MPRVGAPVQRDLAGEDVGVGVARDGEVPLADELADPSPSPKTTAREA